jgi:hypothetical protein
MKSKKNTGASLNELCDQISGTKLLIVVDKKLRQNFAVKSAILFGSQDNRNFVIALGFAKYNMIVYRYI